MTQCQEEKHEAAFKLVQTPKQQKTLQNPDYVQRISNGIRTTFLQRALWWHLQDYDSCDDIITLNSHSNALAPCRFLSPPAGFRWQVKQQSDVSCSWLSVFNGTKFLTVMSLWSHRRNRMPYSVLMMMFVILICSLCLFLFFDSITLFCTTSISTYVFYWWRRCFYADDVTKVLKHSSCWNRPQQLSVRLINLTS